VYNTQPMPEAQKQLASKVARILLLVALKLEETVQRKACYSIESTVPVLSTSCGSFTASG
jgi:hypothetical protein